MQLCPKCGSGVPDDRSTCHICFAEIGPNAQASGPAGLNFATPQSADVTPTPKAPAAAGGMPAIPTPPPPARAAGIPGIPTPAAAPPQQQAPQGIAGMPALTSQTQQPAGGAVPGLPGVYAQQQQDTSAALPNYLRGDAASNAPQSMGGGEMRVSLTGEVIQGPPPTPTVSRMSGVAPGGAPPRPGGPPMPARRAAPASGPMREEAAMEKSGGGGVFLVLLLLIVFGGGGFGGWYWYNNRTNPKDQAVKAFTAVAHQNFAELYPVIAMNQADKAKYSDAAAFAKDQEANITKLPATARAGLDMLKSGTSDVKASEPTMNGDKADVPVTYKLSVMGMSLSMQGTAHMVKDGGIWKLDTRSDNEAEGAKVIVELIGKPDAGAIPGGMSGMPGMAGGRGGRK